MPAVITMGPGGLSVPDEPIIPFIEGDGIGARHLGSRQPGARRCSVRSL